MWLQPWLLPDLFLDACHWEDSPQGCRIPGISLGLQTAMLIAEHARRALPPPCRRRRVPGSEGTWNQACLWTRVWGAPCSAGWGRTASVACPRKVGQAAGTVGAMLRCRAGQGAKWSRSGLRKPWISRVQHVPNLTLLPTSSFSLLLPFLSVLSEKSGFSLGTKAFSRRIPVCQSSSVQAALAVVPYGPS